MSDTDQDLNYSGGGVRLYVDADLSPDATIYPTENQSHYLAHVMRAKIGDGLSLFNGRDGEWSATIAAITKRGLVLNCKLLMHPQRGTPDVWLLLAPIKRTPLDYVTQKATELGVSRIVPVITRRTIVARVNIDRLRANAVEAAEQSGRMTVPEIAAEPTTLPKLLQDWDPARAIIFCDEGGDAQPLALALISATASSFAILTGPEGGFDDGERQMLRAQTFVIPVSLGPRILRADTAALAALAIWQSTRGDWR